MEEIKNGEQPEELADNVQSGIVECEDSGTACLKDNSGSLGKFKDAESMLKAYNNLQAEFTRKCQKLSELSKKYEGENKERVQPDTFTNDEDSLDVTSKPKTVNYKTPVFEEDCSLNKDVLEKELAKEESNAHAESEQSLSLEGNSNSEKAENIPIFKSEDWNEKVSAFLNQNYEAKEYSGEIANEILIDKNLQSSPHALELAWARVMKKEYALPKNLAQNQKFINEQILSREEIKRQVLDEYFKNLQNKKTPPLISASGKVAGVTYKEPTNMLEAKEAVERLFNLKGN